MSIVIGHGLLARSMSRLPFSKSCLILASGVSNSREERAAEFEREVAVVRSALRAHRDARAVYFSTCSVLQQRLTPYAQHKLNMESIVAAESSSFQIYRLPQIVGVTRNLTLISHFVNSLQNERRLTIQATARRNLLGVDDLCRMVFHLVEHEVDPDTVRTVASGCSVPVLEILHAVADILGAAPRFDLINTGESYDFPADFVRAKFGAHDPVLHDAYWRTVLDRYVPLIMAQAAGVVD